MRSRLSVLVTIPPFPVITCLPHQRPLAPRSTTTISLAQVTGTDLVRTYIHRDLTQTCPVSRCAYTYVLVWWRGRWVWSDFRFRTRMRNVFNIEIRAILVRRLNFFFRYNFLPFLSFIDRSFITRWWMGVTKRLLSLENCNLFDTSGLVGDNQEEISVYWTRWVHKGVIGSSFASCRAKHCINRDSNWIKM